MAGDNLAPVEVDPDIPMQDGTDKPAINDLIMHNAPPNGDPPVQQVPLQSVAGPRHITVKEVKDKEPGGLLKQPWIGEFPKAVGSILQKAKTIFEEL